MNGKSYFLAHVGTLYSTLSSATQPTTSYPEMPGKPVHLHMQAPGFSLLHGYHWCKPAGFVLLFLQLNFTGLLEGLVQQAEPRTSTAHKVCYFVPAAAAVAPESPCPGTNRPWGLCCLVGTRRFKPVSFAAPQSSSTCYSVPGAHHYTHK
jgi:hypothetical protein